MNTTLHPNDHCAQKVAQGIWLRCISFNGSPLDLDGDRLDLSEELLCDGPLDATETIPAGGCFSDDCPWSGLYTDMLTIRRP